MNDRNLDVEAARYQPDESDGAVLAAAVVLSCCVLAIGLCLYALARMAG